MTDNRSSPASEQACENTDRHLWPQTSEDAYAPRLFATAGGGIGIDVGGHVIVKPLRDWHALARLSAGIEVLEPRQIADAYSDWAWEKEGTPVGLMLPNDASRIGFSAGAKWAASLQRATPVEVATPTIVECEIGVDNPSICSAGHCRRCSDFRDGWNMSLSTRDLAQPSAGIAEAFDDLKSHRDAWRGAIASHCTPFGSDDDGSYWDHELRAFDRTFDALTRHVAQPPAQSKAEWFCEWLQGYLTRFTGRDELDAFEANTIRNTLNETMGGTSPLPSTDRDLAKDYPADRISTHRAGE